MDRVKMLSNAFVLLSEVDGDFFDASRFLTVSIYIKKLFVLAGKFYPEYIRRYESYAYRLGENGEIFSGTMELDIEEDILPQFTAGQSDAMDYLLVYYRKSPYWGLWFDELAFDEMTDEKDMSVLDFFKKRDKVFEKKLITSLEICEEDHPLKKYYGLFEDVDGCAADDSVILISKLLPYYKRSRSLYSKKERYLCNCVDMGEQALTRWLSGYSFSITDETYDNAYYISCDNSSFWYDGGYGEGVLDHKLEILVAGELIDRCILKLDQKYDFLPEDIKLLKEDGGSEND